MRYFKIHGGHFCQFKLSINIITRDIRDCKNGLNGLDGFGQESSQEDTLSRNEIWKLGSELF